MATRDFPGEAVITLSEVGPNCFELSERHICLDRNQNTVPVGRASKVEAKGFVAASDSGWFNSQVMSRAHGELIADFDRQVLEFCDFGSLHGTYINDENERIPANRPREIHDGDDIRFGVPIMRNGESFTPTRVKVGIKFNDSGIQSARRSTFAVPEGSDVEEGYSSDDCRPIANPKATNTMHRHLFASQDATESFAAGNGGNPLDSNHTGTGEVAGDIIDEAACHVIDLTSTRAISPVAGPLNHSKLLYDSMLGDSRDLVIGDDSLSSPSDIDSLSLDEEDCVSDSDMGSPDDDDDDDDDDQVHSDLEDAYNTDLDDELEFEAEYSSEDGLADTALDRVAFEGEYSSEDEFSNQDDPDTMMWGANPEATTTKAPDGSAAEYREDEQYQVDEDYIEEDQAKKDPVARDQEDNQANEDQIEDTPAEVVSAEVSAESLAPLPKEISPSSSVNQGDAAIDGKPDASSPAEAESYKPDHPTAATRGTIPSILNPVVGLDDSCGSAMLTYNQQTGTPAGRSRPSAGDSILPTSKSMELPPYTHPVAMFPLLASGDEFLNNANSANLGSAVPWITQEPTFVGVPPGDEISAYDFQQKMKALRGEREREISQSGIQRTHINITDIVNNSPQRCDEPAATDGKGKRKSSDISVLSEAEIRWDSQREAKQLGIHTSESSTDAVAAPVSDSSGGAATDFAMRPRGKPSLRRQPASSSVRDTDPARPEHARPAKRMRLRRIAERVGYAALGGATVGAAIVTTLIYTAPSFV